jgi:hypothetical protein
VRHGAGSPVVLRFFFLIAGGLYSVTALRKTGPKVTVYARHLELKQASKQASMHACKRHNQNASR